MLKQISKLLPLLVVILFLMACSVANPKLDNSNGEEIEKTLQNGIATNKVSSQSSRENIPAAIRKALQSTIDPPLNIPSDTAAALSQAQAGKDQKDQQRFNISVNNVPAKEFFAGLVKNTKYNITISPLVSGMISLELKNVTVAEVMDTVREVYGFEYSFTAAGYQVMPRRLETRVFTLNYLDVDRNGKSSMSFGSGELTNTTTQTPATAFSGPATQQQSSVVPSGTVETTSRANFWDVLKQNLTAVIGDKDGRSVVVNPQSGVIIVHAYSDELRSIAEYLDSIQNNMTRQVVIEAQILEVQLNAQFQNGINWKFLDISQGARYSSSAVNPNIAEISNIPNDFSSIFTLQPSSGKTFQSFIQLLNTQGKVNVLSSPRIATTNNQKAVIKVGGDRFFVTNVSSNTTSVGTTSGNTQNIQLTPFFSGIALDVIPQINENEEITLHIHPVISQVTLDRQKFQVNGQAQDLPLAQSTIRESDSVVRARSGQIIVIGGLMQSNASQYGASTPGTEHLGFFSSLFKSNNKTSSKFELVILLRPVVANTNYNWNKNLQEVAERFKNMKSSDFRYRVVQSS